MILFCLTFSIACFIWNSKERERERATFSLKRIILHLINNSEVNCRKGSSSSSNQNSAIILSSFVSTSRTASTKFTSSNFDTIYNPFGMAIRSATVPPLLFSSFSTVFKQLRFGSGCGSVGRAVASDSRGLLFESSHRQKIIYILNICLLSTVYWKDENKEKRGREWPIFYKLLLECRIGRSVERTATYNGIIGVTKAWSLVTQKARIKL